MQPRISSIDHLVLTVANIKATCEFYETILGMTRHDFATPLGDVRTALTFGSQKINLHEKGREFDPKADRPTAGSADLCFLTDTDLSVWVAHLQNHDVNIIEGPVPRTGATGPITSVYIRDPDRNLIEISKRG